MYTIDIRIPIDPQADPDTCTDDEVVKHRIVMIGNDFDKKSLRQLTNIINNLHQQAANTKEGS